MYLIEKLSNKIGSKIATSSNLDKDTEEVIVYGAFTLLQTLWAILWVIVLGAIFKVLVQALIITFTIAVLRKYSGGAHASSPNRCAAIGAIISVSFALITNKLFNSFNVEIVACLGIFIFVFAYYIINRLAPVDSPAKPIVKEEVRRRLKKGAISTLSIFFILIVILEFACYKYESGTFLSIIECIYLGIAWQSFTLTDKGHQLINKIDSALGIVLREKVE